MTGRMIPRACLYVAALVVLRHACYGARGAPRLDIPVIGDPASVPPAVTGGAATCWLATSLELLKT
jgi:hypothetical protein